MRSISSYDRRAGRLALNPVQPEHEQSLYRKGASPAPPLYHH
ncbi:Uncharacterised protein [Vibrio cholerae]|nr:Uncharacterised protein [Vibrio cholerae]